MEVVMPSQERIEEIRTSGMSGNIFWREVGPYQLSVIYRRSSAMGGPDWYPEGMIFLVEGETRKPVYQDDGWGVFRLFSTLENQDEVESVLKPSTEDRAT